jgi:hypothetical protein
MTNAENDILPRSVSVGVAVARREYTGTSEKNEQGDGRENEY